jgi:uncharacterized membrane protein YheB (UPF0754 family)
MQPAQRCVNFDSALIKSIDEAVTTLLSSQVTDALYVHLERVHSVSKIEIPNRLDALTTTLEETFGDQSSKTISKAIAKRLYTALELDFSPTPNGTLIDYIDVAKMKLEGKGV